MSYHLLGVELNSPVIAGSSPLSLDGESMIALDRMGAGAVVTKNVCLSAGRNPKHYMRVYEGDTLLNCERKLDYPGERWIEQEIPKAVKAGVKVIANVGMNRELTAPVVQRLEDSGVCMIECVSYRAEWLAPMVEDTKRRVKIPVIAKLSPNYTDFLEIARQCRESGADAFTCGDSIGPVMKIDIETGCPMVGGAEGIGWMSGAALKPFAVKRVVDLRQAFPLPIIGMGGVTTWEDCVEMVLAGADFVGVCSALVTRGPQALTEMNTGIQDYLLRHKKSLTELRGEALRHLPKEDCMEPSALTVEQSRCTRCGACVRMCVYKALEMTEQGVVFQSERCSGCGVCTSLCKAVIEKIKQGEGV